MPRYYFDDVKQDLAQERLVLEREPNKGRGAYRLRDALDDGLVWTWADTLKEVLDEAQGIREARLTLGLSVVDGVLCLGNPKGRNQIQVGGHVNGERLAWTQSLAAPDWKTVLVILRKAYPEVHIDRVRA